MHTPPHCNIMTPNLVLLWDRLMNYGLSPTGDHSNLREHWQWSKRLMLNWLLLLNFTSTSKTRCNIPFLMTQYKSIRLSTSQLHRTSGPPSWDNWCHPGTFGFTQRQRTSVIYRVHGPRSTARGSDTLYDPVVLIGIPTVTSVSSLSSISAFWWIQTQPILYPSVKLCERCLAISQVTP